MSQIRKLENFWTRIKKLWNMSGVGKIDSGHLQNTFFLPLILQRSATEQKPSTLSNNKHFSSANLLSGVSPNMFLASKQFLTSYWFSTPVITAVTSVCIVSERCQVNSHLRILISKYCTVPLLNFLPPAFSGYIFRYLVFFWFSVGCFFGIILCYWVYKCFLSQKTNWICIKSTNCI